MAERVHEGQTILLDGGETTLEVARHLRHSRLTVVTHDLRVGLEIATKPSINLVFIGGELLPSGFGMWGPTSVQQVETLRVNVAIFGARTVMDDGIYSTSSYEIELKRKMLSIASEAFFVADSSKFGREALFKVFGFEDFTAGITDAMLDPIRAAQLPIPVIRVAVGTPEKDRPGGGPTDRKRGRPEGGHQRCFGVPERRITTAELAGLPRDRPLGDPLNCARRLSGSGRMSGMSTRTVHTFCRYCLASCGIEVTVEGNRVAKISADKQNPHTWRDFCAKGRTANQLVEHPRRILNPMRRVGDTYIEASWDEAIADIAARMNAVIEADGPDAVGAYYGNPAGFSSSNIIFYNGWLDAIGTHSRYSVGSVDQNAMHVVASAMYGSMLMAPVSDIDNCDYFLLVGTNPAVSAWNWLETVPGGWKRALERQKGGAKIVVVDPLRTESAEHADVHLAVRPGQDWALLLAMVKVILDEALEHAQDCTDLATGVPELRKLVAEADLDDLASRCDVPRADIEQTARDFASARGAMVVTRTGVSMHLAGTVAEWLGHVLNVITGRMDRPGGRRYEPGYVDAIGLSGMVKARPHYSRLHGRQMVAGAHALSELPDEITTAGPGRIRAMVINCGNPVVSGPDGAKARCGIRATGSVGGHRLRSARKPPARALVAACRALAGTR